MESVAFAKMIIFWFFPPLVHVIVRVAPGPHFTVEAFDPARLVRTRNALKALEALKGSAIPVYSHWVESIQAPLLGNPVFGAGRRFGRASFRRPGCDKLGSYLLDAEELYFLAMCLGFF